MFTFCPSFALLNFLGGKLTFQLGPILAISGSLAFKDKYLISTLTPTSPTSVNQDLLEKKDATLSSL
jgi:hypothetical protein